MAVIVLPFGVGVEDGVEVAVSVGVGVDVALAVGEAVGVTSVLVTTRTIGVGDTYSVAVGDSGVVEAGSVGVNKLVAVGVGVGSVRFLGNDEFSNAAKINTSNTTTAIAYLFFETNEFIFISVSGKGMIPGSTAKAFNRSVNPWRYFPPCTSM